MRRNYSKLAVIVKDLALPAALLLAGTVLVFVPSAMYRNNQPFFAFHLVEFLVNTVPIATGLALLATLPAALWGWNRYARLLTGLAAAVWVNATFTVGTSGLMDGNSFRLVRNTTALTQNALLFIAVTAAGYLVARRYVQQTRTFLLLLVALLSIQTVYIVLTVKGTAKVTTDVARFGSFSKSGNLLLVLMDAFAADFFAELVEQAPGMAKPLTGFTLFPDTATVAPSTSVVLPTLHNGKIWDGATPLPGFYETAVAQGSFLTALVSGGYDGVLVNPHFGVCPKDVMCQRLADVAAGESVSANQSMAEMLDLSLLRAAPHVLKPVVYREGKWLFSGLGSRNLVNDASTSNAVLDILTAGLTVDSPKPTVKFLHLMSTHPPVQHDSTCNPVTHAHWTRATALAQSECAMKRFLALIERMKRENIYDATAIILFADHGSWTPRHGVASLAIRANPLLLIKPAGATGALRISKAQASLADFPATACALVRACKWSVGDDVTALVPSARRDRTFVDFKWRREYWERGIFPIYGRYRLQGPVLDLNSWHLIPSADAQAIHQLTFTSKDPIEGFGPGWRNAGSKPPRWTTAAQAVVWVSPRPGGTGRVTALVSTHDGNTAQQMTVKVAGEMVFQGTVKPGQPQEVEFQIPRKALQQPQIALRFTFSQWNPERAQKQDTPRAVAFHRLEIQ